jgi:DNA polymerase-3 subunit alpha
MAKFIPLTTKSSFSLLGGTMPTKKLAKLAAKRGYPALGVIELGTQFSAAEASKYFPGEGVQPILGAELPVLGLAQQGTLGRETIGMLTLLVQNEQGWRNLAALASKSQQRKIQENTNGDAAVTLEEVLANHEGLICMSGPYGRGWAALAQQQGRLEAYLEPLAQTFGNRFYLQLRAPSLAQQYA